MKLKMKSDVALVSLVTGKRYGGQNLVAGEKFIVRASDVRAVKALGWATDFIGDEPPKIWEEPVVAQKEPEVIRKDENSEPASDNDSEHVDLPVEEEKEEAPAKPKRTYKRRALVAE